MSHYGKKNDSTALKSDPRNSSVKSGDVKAVDDERVSREYLKLARVYEQCCARSYHGSNGSGKESVPSRPWDKTTRTRMQQQLQEMENVILNVLQPKTTLYDAQKFRLEAENSHESSLKQI